MTSQEVVGCWQQTCGGIKQRGASLLRSGLWADCAFLVGASQQRIPAHRFLLGIASPVFERMFYSALPHGGDPVRVDDIHPDAFRTLLEYIYTDEIRITSVSHGCELYRAAHKYMLSLLVQVCSTYLSCNLGSADACRCYELARLFDDEVLLDKALELITSDTKDVLKADSFLEADLSTVVMVFKQEALNIDSEIDLLTAAERYAVSLNSKLAMPRCLRQGNETSQADTSSQGNLDTDCGNENSQLFQTILDSESDTSQSSQPDDKNESSAGWYSPLSSLVRPSTSRPDDTLTIRDAVRQVRFLTLTAQQFTEGPVHSSQLTREECLAILINISSKSSQTPMPSGLSTSREKRNQHSEYVMKKPTIRLVVNNFYDRIETVQSDLVVSQDISWRLEMNPGGETDVNRNVGLFLHYCGAKWSDISGYIMVIESELRLLSTLPGMKLTRTRIHSIPSADSSRDYKVEVPDFIPWVVLANPINGYIRNDTVTFEAHIVMRIY